VLGFSGLRPDQTNRASSLTNFFRNWGGSFGVAFITTMAERRQNFHQARLGNALTASSFPLQAAIHQTATYLQHNGMSATTAMQAATLRYYDQLTAQTRLLAFMDCFHIVGIVTFIAAPLVWFTHNFKAGNKAPEGH
jgi:DHA2 family multidrug resistance protein